ncbi:MAG TPA: DMT family transporter [Reyranella sp.]|nr:DMT family transporter [Reyranella sp.]
MKTPVHQESSAALGVALIVAGSVIFSSAGAIVRNIELPSWDIAFWRSTLLVATFLPLLAWQYRRIWIDIRNAGRTLLLSGLFMAGTMVAFIVALKLAPVANVLIVYATTPFLTAVFARLFLGEPLHRHTVLALIAAAAGFSLSVAGSLQAGAFAGMAVASIVALSMASNNVVVRHRRDVGMTPSLMLAALIAALVALPFARPATVELHQLPWLAALGPGQLAAGFLLYMAALKRIPAARAALVGLLEPVLGPIWVWVIYAERPDDLTLLGGAIVIGSAAANVWLDSRRSTG